MRTSLRFTSRCRVALAAMLMSTAGAALADTASPALPEPSLPTVWKQWNGHYYRLEADGHLSCYSENSAKSACSINAPGDPAKAQPLRCNEPRWGGKAHKRTGYQVVGHWCNTAYANLFAEWKSYERLGFDMQLATTPAGDVMCKSSDGTRCLPANTSASTNPIDPLVCGRTYAKRIGGLGTGYDDPTHWCNSPQIALHAVEPSPSLNPEGPNPFWFNRAWNDRSIRKGPYNYSATLQFPLRGWRSSEQPVWILRFRLHPKPGDSQRLDGIRLGLRSGVASGDDVVEKKRAETVLAKILGRHRLYFGNGKGSDLRLDAENRGTLVIRLDPAGQPRFIQQPGWPLDILAGDYDVERNDQHIVGYSGDPEWIALKEDGLELKLWVHEQLAYIDSVEAALAALPSVKEVLLVHRRTPRQMP